MSLCLGCGAQKQSSLRVRNHHTLSSHYLVGFISQYSIDLKIKFLQMGNTQSQFRRNKETRVRKDNWKDYTLKSQSGYSVPGQTLTPQRCHSITRPRVGLQSKWLPTQGFLETGEQDRQKKYPAMKASLCLGDKFVMCLVRSFLS